MVKSTDYFFFLLSVQELKLFQNKGNTLLHIQYILKTKGPLPNWVNKKFGVFPSIAIPGAMVIRATQQEHRQQ